jgi:hypothetical protein
VPAPTKAEIDHGVPVFLDQLGDALRLGRRVRLVLAMIERNLLHKQGNMAIGRRNHPLGGPAA